MFFRAFDEFPEVISFRYYKGRDLITTVEDQGKDWINNFGLFGRFSPTGNAIKLNNYISKDGGSWKSYVFLAKNPDPLTFNTSNSKFLLLNFYIPGINFANTNSTVSKNNNCYTFFDNACSVLQFLQKSLIFSFFLLIIA